MISSTSRRLPRKTCGLFDTGYAGDSDVTSMDSGVLTAVDQSMFSFEDPQPFNPPNSVVEPKAIGLVQDTDKPEAPIAMVDMDWPTDLLDPLGGLDDPLGDNSLDAFVNLDTLLMGDTFLDECEPTTGVTAEPVESIGDAQLFAEVKPVIELIEPQPQPQPSKPVKASRKRKAGKPASQPVKTSLFEIPVSSADHAYTAKQQRVSPPEEVVTPQTATTSGISTSKVNVEEKQAVRRMKNNVASKRSREQRKAKFAEMDNEADYLTEENERLRNKIVELEQTAKEMKALLVAKMAGKA